MKKILFIGALSVLIFTACGNSNQQTGGSVPAETTVAAEAKPGNESTETTEPAAVEETEPADPYEGSEIIGTYIGNDRSCLIIYPDGTLDYYQDMHDSLSENIPFVYANGMFKFHDQNENVDLFANMPNGETAAFVLRSDADDKKNVEYTKESSDEKKLSKQDLTDLINAKLPATFKLNYWGIEYEMPSYYSYEEGTFNWYPSEYGCSSIQFMIGNMDMTEEEFKTQRDHFGGMSAGFLENYNIYPVEFLKSQDYSVAGHSAFMFVWDVDDEFGNPGKCYIVLIFDEETEKIITVLFDHYLPCSNKDASCEEDFLHMLETAVPIENNLSERVIDTIDASEKTEEVGSSESVEEPKSETEAMENRSGISDEFKKAMDGYEEYFDEYIQIMEQVKNNPSDLALISKYTEFMGTYADTMAKFEAIEDSEMTDEEAAYYIEVQNRINQKLLSVQ